MTDQKDAPPAMDLPGGPRNLALESVLSHMSDAGRLHFDIATLRAELDVVRQENARLISENQILGERLQVPVEQIIEPKQPTNRAAKAAKAINS